MDDSSQEPCEWLSPVQEANVGTGMGTERSHISFSFHSWDIFVLENGVHLFPWDKVTREQLLVFQFYQNIYSNLSQMCKQDSDVVLQ